MATLGTGMIAAPKRIQPPIPPMPGGVPGQDVGRAGSLSYGMATIPAPVPPMSVPPLGATAPPFSPFGGQAPTPTPYGTFTAPDQSTFNRSADSLYLQGEQQKALQRSAAARGTLLSGGFAKRLQENAQGLAGQDFQNEYNRQLGTYNTNRDTNAQNFGQQMGQFQGNLGAYNANTSAQLGYGRLGLDTAEANRGAAYQDAQNQRDFLQQQNEYNAAQQNMGSLAAADEYARQVAAARQQNAATSAVRPAQPYRSFERPKFLPR